MKDGIPVNDDKGLEHKADVMRAKAWEPAEKFHREQEGRKKLQGPTVPGLRQVYKLGEVLAQPIVQRSKKQRKGFYRFPSIGLIAHYGCETVLRYLKN